VKVDDITQKDIDDMTRIFAKKVRVQTEVAQDFIQQALLEIYRQGEEVRSLTGFVLTVAKRRFLNDLRDNRKHDRFLDPHSAGTVSEEGVGEPVWGEDGLAGQVREKDWADERDYSKGFLMEDPERREVLYLLSERVPIKEVAVMTGVTQHYVEKWRREYGEKHREGGV